MGRVCDKHGEWCPDGQCRWCEPVGMRWVANSVERTNDLLRLVITEKRMQDAMNRMWAMLAAR